MILIVLSSRREPVLKLVAEEAMWIGSNERDADSRDRFSWRQEGEASVEVAFGSSTSGLARGVLATSTSMSSLSNSFAAMWNAGAVMVVFVYFASAQCLKIS